MLGVPAAMAQPVRRAEASLLRSGCGPFRRCTTRGDGPSDRYPGGVSEPVEFPAPAGRPAAPHPAAEAGPAPVDGVPPRPLPRHRRAGAWVTVGMVLFGIGLLAIVAVLVLFASGGRDLPVWLNVTAMLAPAGLGVGLIGVLREVRRPAREARAAGRA